MAINHDDGTADDQRLRGLLAAGGLLGAVAALILLDKEALMILESIITCPQCGAAKAETMPTDACWFL